MLYPHLVPALTARALLSARPASFNGLLNVTRQAIDQAIALQGGTGKISVNLLLVVITQPDAATQDYLDRYCRSAELQALLATYPRRCISRPQVTNLQVGGTDWLIKLTFAAESINIAA